MKPRIILWSGLAAVWASLGFLVGCDYSAAPDQAPVLSGRVRSGYVPSSTKSRTPGLTSKVAVSARASEERTAILESSITLIKRAAVSPGGDNFRLAVQKLNHYFEGTSPSQYLLESAARQMHLRRLLGLSPQPRYWHLPLVIGPDGKRLAKRHGDTRIAHYRDAGATPQRILGLVAYWSGMNDHRREIDMAELIRCFDLGKLPRQAVVFGGQDDDFLCGR